MMLQSGESLHGSAKRAPNPLMQKEKGRISPAPHPHP